MSQLTDDIQEFLADDMEVLRELMHTVRGLMPVSTSPELEAQLSEDLELDFDATA